MSNRIQQCVNEPYWAVMSWTGGVMSAALGRKRVFNGYHFTGIEPMTTLTNTKIVETNETLQTKISSSTTLYVSELWSPLLKSTHKCQHPHRFTRRNEIRSL